MWCWDFLGICTCALLLYEGMAAEGGDTQAPVETVSAAAEGSDTQAQTKAILSLMNAFMVDLSGFKATIMDAGIVGAKKGECKWLKWY